MASEPRKVAANAAYDMLCNTLDSAGWNYDKNTEKKTVSTGMASEDLNIMFGIQVSEERQLITLDSGLPFTVPEEHRLNMAVGINEVNRRLMEGMFKFNFKTGNLYFRITASFENSPLSEKDILHMLLYSGKTVDTYNDKIFLLSKGVLSVEQFFEAVSK